MDDPRAAASAWAVTPLERLLGTHIASSGIEVPSGESRPIAMLGPAHVVGTTRVTMECTQQNLFQFSSLVSAGQCTGTAVARP